MANAIAAEAGHLDMLFANAALLGDITPLVDLDPTVWDDCIAVNVSSVWRLIRSCNGLLMASSAARVVFVTAPITKREVVDMGIYAISKIALEALARIYAAEKRGTVIRANAFDPGPIRTRMRAKVVPHEDPSTVTSADALVPDLLRMLSPSYDENGMRFDFRSRETVPLRPCA
jgi:NAD(P)-dependent dehydrogenase (short-subunit alcohol dehydrogenase family)